MGICRLMSTSKRRTSLLTAAFFFASSAGLDSSRKRL